MAQNILQTANTRETFLRRISWGAIFAGVVVVLITHMMLSLLGVAFGAGSIAPLEEANPLSGLGVGSAIWLASSTLISLFAGGWVAARLAGIADRTESTLHGIVTWGLSSLVAAYLITTAATGLVSGAAGVVGKTASLIGQGAQAVGPEIAKAVGDQLGMDNGTWKQVKTEVGKLLKQTSADTEVLRLWQRIEARGDFSLTAVDKEDLINLLADRTEMSEAEATATVAQWEQTLNTAKAQVAQAKEQAAHKGREIADSTARVVSQAAAWSFAGLLIGLIASALGGFLGAARYGKEPFFYFSKRQQPAAA